jgi:UDP-N-acetylenolpyruvoylglucosamine reductase
MKTIKNKSVYEKNISGYKGKAKLIVYPESIQEIENLVKFTKGDIVPRGTGVNFTGSTIPNNSTIIDMSKMNKILDINKNRKTVYAEAGVLITELNQELEKHNLELPITPLLSDLQTLGGTIATNSPGDRELKYGSIRSWIESLEVVDGSAKLQEIPKADSSDFVGMEGTTGIITRVKLKLTTKKQRTLSILKSDSFRELLDASRELKLDHEVSMLILFDKTLSLLSGLENKYHLFVEYESEKGNLKNGFYRKFMNIKDDAYYTLASNGYTLLENPKFFMNHLEDFAFYLEEKRIPFFANLGSGTIYFCTNPQKPELQKQALELLEKLRAKPTYGLGVGLTKRKFLDRNERQLTARIILRRDPQYKFNKGKIVDIILPSSEPDKQPEQKQDETKETPTEEKTEETNESEEQKSDKTPDQEMQEFLEEQKAEDILSSKPLEKTPEQEEKEKVAKIAKEIVEGASIKGDNNDRQ